MSFLTQLSNSLQYQLHQATYNPDAEQYATDKAAADKKAAEDAAAQKKSDEDAAKAKAEAESPANTTTDTSGVCFGSPITLSATNFFASDIFDAYVAKLGDGRSTGYLFETLMLAQTNVKSKPGCTGIIGFTIKDGPASGQPEKFLLYTADPTLTNTVKPGSRAAFVVDFWKTIEFIPLVSCITPDDASDDFSWSRLLTRILSITITIVGIFLLIVAGLYGASLATNLNLYREAPIRVLYAIYGFLFFWISIPYSLLYRWWWKGRKPVFYALIPLIPYKFDNRYAAMMFSWMSFKPDDQIACLMEWKH